MSPRATDATLDRILAAPERGRRILIRGAAIVSLDPDVGDLPRGDLLISETTIEAVGPDLSEAAADGQAITVDAEGCVLIPGMVDGHRHSWQSQFRRFICDVDLPGYLDMMHMRLGPAYEPEDMYAGTLLAAAGALDSGVTCVLDFSHNSRSAAYSDEAIRAWKDSGARVAFASCVPMAEPWDRGWREDLRRLREQHFADDHGLATLRMGVGAKMLPDTADGDLWLSADGIRHARELDIGISVDAVLGTWASEHVVEVGATGLLGPDVTWIHCTELTDEAWSVILDSGGRVVMAVTSDQQLGCGGGLPPIQKAIDLGVLPGLSVDVECSLTTDMFTQMQVTVNTQRMHAEQRRLHGDHDAPANLPVRAALEYATVGGAHANGVADRCGSLTPGKQADLVLIDAQDVNNLPLNNAVATVVLGADARNVKTVFVAGQPRKWDGALVGIDVADLRRLATDSRDRLLERIGHELDVTASFGMSEPV
jgi:cytosine/adenosine deaminase-related metal-dependent hydrolase